MSRLHVVLLIIAGIGVGAGTLLFGVLMLCLDSYRDDYAGMAAIGAGLLAASGAGLAALLFGELRQLTDERDERDL
jgi:hypothetical protein